jgi:hypothetical protein
VKDGGQPLTEWLAEKLAAAVKIPTTKWSDLKDYGDRAFKSDKAAATALLDALDELGIVAVKVGVVGELRDRYHRTEGTRIPTHRARG